MEDAMKYCSLKNSRQPERRLAVVATYAVFAVGMALAVYGKAHDLLWVRLIAAVAMVPCIAGYTAIRGYASQYLGQACMGSIEFPDEREATVRDRAMARAYRVVVMASIIAVGWMMIADNDPRVWVPRSSTDWFGVLVVIQVVMGSLPQAMITWGERDLEEFGAEALAGGAGFFPSK